MMVNSKKQIEVYEQQAAEAYVAFLTARRLLFWPMFLGLLAIGATFFAVDLGLANQAVETELGVEIVKAEPRGGMRVFLTSAEAEGEGGEVIVEDAPAEVLPPMAEAPPEKGQGPGMLEGAPPELGGHGHGPLGDERAVSLGDALRRVLRVCHYVVFFSGVSYALSLLVGVKLSITGRINGVGELSKAFFVALLAVVIMLPWQRLFWGHISGVLFHFDELANAYALKTQLSESGMPVLTPLLEYYGRFVVLWAVSLLLLVAAHLKGAKATKMARTPATLAYPVHTPTSTMVVNNVQPGTEEE